MVTKIKHLIQIQYGLSFFTRNQGVESAFLHQDMAKIAIFTDKI